MGITASWKSGPGELSVLVHGGAGRLSGAALSAAVTGCERAAASASELLNAGACALDAVQRAVEWLEDDPVFNAGTGGALCSDGSLELDASIMEGAGLRAGAVCALPPHRHPIAVARAVLDTGVHVLYAGAGADALARAKGFVPADSGTMITEHARQQLERARKRGRATLWAGGGTVGAVARDSAGHVAAATSTGGLPGQAPGRVGDSAILGAGTLADDARGACSVTGDGDAILRVSTASEAVFRLAHGADLEAAARESIATLLERTGALGGLILAGPDGSLAFARSTETMSWAAVQGERAWSGG